MATKKRVAGPAAQLRVCRDPTRQTAILSHHIRSCKVKALPVTNTNNGGTTGETAGRQREATGRQQGDNRETAGRQQGARGRQQGDNRETKGTQKGNKGRPKGNKRDKKGDKGKQRETTGKQQGDKGKQRETKGKRKDTKVNKRLKVFLPVQPVPKGSTAEVGGRMWARRWRAKWGARYGRLAILDDVSLAREARQGSAILGSAGSGIWVPGAQKARPFWGSDSESKNGFAF